MTAKSFYSFSSFVTLVAFRFLTRKVSSCLGEGVICYFTLPPHPLLKKIFVEKQVLILLTDITPQKCSPEMTKNSRPPPPPPSRKFRQKGVADLERTPPRVKSV